MCASGHHHLEKIRMMRKDVYLHSCFCLTYILFVCEYSVCTCLCVWMCVYMSVHLHIMCGNVALFYVYIWVWKVFICLSMAVSIVKGWGYIFYVCVCKMVCTQHVYLEWSVLYIQGMGSHIYFIYEHLVVFLSVS